LGGSLERVKVVKGVKVGRLGLAGHYLRKSAAYAITISHPKPVKRRLLG
jgi:hypothetical protein